MGKIVIPYKPHAGQLLLHNDTHRFKTIVCGRRWGKTVYADNKLIRKAIENPGPYGYVAPTYSQAKLITWELLKHYSVPEIRRGKPNETDLSINYVNGGQVRLFGADKADRLRGTKFKGLIVDEYADMKRKIWELVLRATLADYRGWCDFLGTPKGKLNHLYENFIRDQKHSDPSYLTVEGNPISVDPDYASFQFKTADNPYIDRREIEDARRTLAPAYFRQEWEASFENYTGIIYKEFTDDCICHDFKPELWHKVLVGIDTGRHTGISFIAFDHKADATVFDEIYDLDGTVRDISTKIKQKCLEWKIKPMAYVIDSASQVKAEYRAAGIGILDSRKDLENQISLVRSAFGSGKLKIDSRCRMHIVEHKGYIWNEKAKKPEPVKENDHTCSSVQYVYSTYATGAVEHPSVAIYRKSLAYANIQTDHNALQEHS